MTSPGYQVSSLKAYLTTPKGVLSTFRKLRDIGYRHLQLQWIDPSVPIEFTEEALRETGLTCVATQESFLEVRDHLDHYIRMNRLWGSRILCVSTIPRQMMTRDGVARFAAEMGDMSRVLGEQGISLTFHPIQYNFDPVDGASAVDIVMDALSSDVGLTLCVAQAVWAGRDPIALLERYTGRVEICHFKDSAVFPDGREYLVPVGQGRIDWPPIFEACRHAKVKWGLAEQENWQKDAFVCARESLEYLTRFGM